MDVRQLNALTAVADHRSFSAAARALHTVQSNVSTHVARLEAELATELVDRTTGALTEAGELVVARARRVQAELEALVADVTSASAEVVGSVRIGVIGTTGRWLAPLLLREMTAAHPRVRVVIVDATTTSLLPQLGTGTLDLALVNLPLDDPDVDIEPLFEEDRVLIAPHDHPLARVERIDLASLADHELLLEPVGTAFRDELDAEARRVGVTLRTQAEADGMRLLASLVINGFGPAVLPATAIPTWYQGEWRNVAIDGLPPRSVGIATRRRALPSAPARALVAVLRRVVKDAVPGLIGLRLLDASHGPSGHGPVRSEERPGSVRDT